METKNFLDRIILFCLKNPLVVILITAVIIVFGLMTSPFDSVSLFGKKPVPVDAIPDIGENQQIVFTEWMGRSPKDIENQITYPLTVSLLGLPGVKTIRSYSYFGYSTIYIIFEDNIEFYWSRSRILEKLNSLGSGTLPDNVTPTLGPDATSLGQIFWYTLEGRDEKGEVTGGWDLQELRSAQDWYVKYAFQSVNGVSEVASIGGFVKEYQVDVDPDSLRAFGVSLDEVYQAVKNTNMDVGARSIEINRVEYLIRGVGYVKSLKDLESTVVKVKDNTPVTLRELGKITYGTAMRMGALDKEGAEVVGGVVVARYGENPLQVIQNVKKKMQEIAVGLPQKTLSDGTISKISIVPFYDRTKLIHETLDTLKEALIEESIITVIVVILMVRHLLSSLLISALLPIVVLITFIAMKYFHVDANIVALSGIAIAIGDIVDMGIIITENILRHRERSPDKNLLSVVYEGTSEIASAVLTSISTTVISFLPVFALEAAEGKLFKPLAYTKTFAISASVLAALILMPMFLYYGLQIRFDSKKIKKISGMILIIMSLPLFFFQSMIGLVSLMFGFIVLGSFYIPAKWSVVGTNIFHYLVVFLVIILLTIQWMPLGIDKGNISNTAFVLILISLIMSLFGLFQKYYHNILSWCLDHKYIFLSFPTFAVLFGFIIGFGFERVFTFIPFGFEKMGLNKSAVIHSFLWKNAAKIFPGLGKEFMPSLDEGSFLFMPTTMAHASIGEGLDVLQKLDMAIAGIPEIQKVVGKIGRAESSLDPAHTAMIETIIEYKDEYMKDENGNLGLYQYHEELQTYARDEKKNLIPDKNGKPFRQWRKHIKDSDDIWNEIIQAAKLPGTTSAPKLQPIAARVVMLQSGMRAPMGVKIQGPDLNTLETVGLQIEKFLKEVPSVESDTVIADRVVGKPYLEIDIQRDAISRYGLTITQVQDIIEIAVGGKMITSTVEGRERYPIRVRYMRELRDSIESLEKIMVPTPSGAQVPLIQLATITYIRGPQVIRSEDTFLTGYVIFDKKAKYAEVDVVNECNNYLLQKIDTGELRLPPGVSFRFSGSYENQVRSEQTLMIVIPITLLIIFIILYFEFRSVLTSAFVFSAIFVAWAGGFIMLWLYGQSWFMNFKLFEIDFQQLFQIRPFNLSIAVWVGFIALFGVASDDGVVMASYLDQIFASRKMNSIAEIRAAVIEGGMKRIRPCLMTVATTILALIPLLTSSGRGSDIMIPMGIPSFGGMTIVLLSVFMVPVLYCMRKEYQFRKYGVHFDKLSDQESSVTKKAQ